MRGWNKDSREELAGWGGGGLEQGLRFQKWGGGGEEQRLGEVLCERITG